MKERNHLCLLCGGHDFCSYRMNLIKCKVCALVMDTKIWNGSSNIEMDEEWFEEVYSLTPSFWVRIFERWNNKRTWSRLANFFQKPEGKTVLEIGVGSGSFLNFMKSKGFDVSGCDMSKAISKYVENTFGIPMYNVSISDLPTDFEMDMIVMNHVLEHVNNPVDFLRDLRSKMKSNGLLHLAVPNIAAWEAFLTGWNSYEPYHLVYFTPDTLKATVEQAGFAVTTLCTYESFSGWFLAIIRTLLKTHSRSAKDRNLIRKKRETSLVEHIYRIAMIISGVVLCPIRLVQSRVGYGDEVIIIAKPGLSDDKDEY